MRSGRGRPNAIAVEAALLPFFSFLNRSPPLQSRIAAATSPSLTHGAVHKLSLR